MKKLFQYLKNRYIDFRLNRCIKDIEFVKVKELEWWNITPGSISYSNNFIRPVLKKGVKPNWYRLRLMGLMTLEIAEIQDYIVRMKWKEIEYISDAAATQYFGGFGFGMDTSSTISAIKPKTKYFNYDTP